MKIYLDNAATTPVDADVFDKILPFFWEAYGSPDSQHFLGRQSEQAVMRARRQVSDALGANENEIYFTSCGSESNSWALKGAVWASKLSNPHIITSKIEHSSVLNAVEQLADKGIEVTYLSPDKDGIISVNSLKAALKENTVLVSVMLANNEIGTIQPIKDLVEEVKKFNSDIIFHTDAVQAIGMMPVDVNDLGVDMLSLSSHKFYGPKGAGVLYIKSNVKIDRLINGGKQERGQRGGTTNVPAVVGTGYAIEKAVEDLEHNCDYIKNLRDKLIDTIEKEIPNAVLNGHRTKRLCGNVNFSFQYADSQGILTMLDINGIATSIGSACTAGNFKPSYVLMALGVPEELASSSIRLSIGKHNTTEEIEYTIKKLKEIILSLRKMSPLFVNIKTEKHLS